MTDNDGSGNREQTLEFLVGEVVHSRAEIEEALVLYGYNITDQGEFTAVDEATGVTTEMPREVVLSALSDYFVHMDCSSEELSGATSDNLPAVIPPSRPSDSSILTTEASVSRGNQLGDDWYVPESQPIDEEQHPDYIDEQFHREMFQNKMGLGRRFLIAGAVLLGLTGAFVLGDYSGTSKTEASNAAEIAQLKSDVSGYQTKLSVRKGVENKLMAELGSLKTENEKISIENAELFEMVTGLEGQLAGSQELVDQQIDLDSCNADYAVCRTEKEVIEAACNARVAGLEKQTTGAVVPVAAACDCDDLNGQVAKLEGENSALVGFNNDYDAANTAYQKENTELTAKVLACDGKFAGLEFDLAEKQIAFDSCNADYVSCKEDKEAVESQFVVNPYQQILTILNGPEEERPNGLKNLVINYLKNRTVGRKMVVDGNDCNTALGNLYNTIVGEAGDLDEVARVGFVTYVPQICGNLDPNQDKVEFALTK